MLRPLVPIVTVVVGSQMAAGSLAHSQGQAGPKFGADFFKMATDCQRKLCEDGNTDKFRHMFARAGASQGSTTGVGIGAGNKSKPECPSKDDIGMCTWTLVSDGRFSIGCLSWFALLSTDNSGCCL